MADSRIKQEIRELKQKILELEQAQRNVLGSRSNPLDRPFIRSSKTGRVARLDYDSDADDTFTTKVG